MGGIMTNEERENLVLDLTELNRLVRLYPNETESILKDYYDIREKSWKKINEKLLSGKASSFTTKKLYED